MRTIAFVLLVALVIFSLWVGVLRYRECRAHGFSRFYCATQR